MTVIEQAIRTKLVGHAPLVALIGDRVWWNEAKHSAVRPFVILARTAAERDSTLDGATGFVSSTYSIEIYTDQARSQLAAGKASQIREAVEAAINGFSGTSAGVLILDCELVQDRVTFLPDPDAGEIGTIACVLTFRIDYEETV